jgi:Ni,Fe-hydrogenase I large subunit
MPEAATVLENQNMRGVMRCRFMKSCGTIAATLARLVRNLLAGSQNVQDHVVHFCHLHALDWAHVTRALKADPGKTAQPAQSISERPQSSTTDFKGVQDRVQALVASRQLSLFSSGDWGHPAYQLPPEANLLAVAHYIEALDMQRDFIRIHAVLGGKNPYLQTYLGCGTSTAIGGNEPVAAISPERITHFDARECTRHLPVASPAP